MRLLFFLMLFCLSVATRAQLRDEFSDGDFTRHPTWTGDTAFFRVNADFQLQTNGPEAASVLALATPITLQDSTVWEFSVNLAFAPSGNNYGRIYLISDQADLKKGLNGYYVRTGENGVNDGVDLFYQQGTTHTRLITGNAGRAANHPNLYIRVTRGPAGQWQLFSRQMTETALVTEGTALNPAWNPVGYAGVVCTHTATNGQHFVFDDFNITSRQAAPSVAAPIGLREVIINEIMADESPGVGLPAAEFVELYNPTTRTINLSQCTLGDAASQVRLPDFALPPKGYVTVCARAFAGSFQPFGPVIGVPAFPALNNAGDQITLRSATGLLIDQVRYNRNWYGEEAKSDGGWSLEQIDPANACGEETNWTAAVAQAGGTPGSANSVAASKPDFTPPTLLTAEVTAPNQISLMLTERMDSVSATNPLNYHVTPSIDIQTLSLAQPAGRTVVLTLPDSLPKGVLYELIARNLKDCNGNPMTSPQKISFARPLPADSADVVINEVLFNPRVGGVDFVEIYNRSAKFISLKNWQLANEQAQSLANLKGVGPRYSTLPPGAYAVFTTNANVLTTHYPKAKPETFVVMPALPAFPDQAGTVVLLNEQNKIIDQFTYSEDLHSPMLADKEGVSLERLRFDAPTHDGQNWHSAAATEGYATPGYRNSQSLTTPVTDATLRAEPAVITPNGDGYHDFATFHYHFGAPGNVATATVFDSFGRPVRQLLANQSLATEGLLTWDGTGASGAKVRAGRYVVSTLR